MTPRSTLSAGSSPTTQSQQLHTNTADTLQADDDFLPETKRLLPLGRTTSGVDTDSDSSESLSTQPSGSAANPALLASTSQLQASISSL